MRKKSKHLNIRQAYQDLEKELKELKESYTILQRTVKLILLSQEKTSTITPGTNFKPLLFFKDKVSNYYTQHELDKMQLTVTENKELERVEITI